MKKISYVLIVSSLLLTATTSAQTANHIVISQVYGGGGNAGAPYTNDFIELFNPTSAPVDLTGWSVQYAAAASANWSMTTLTGTIAANTYYLIQQSGGANGVPLPAPDASGTTNLSATAGKILLSNAAVAFVVMCPAVPSIVDFVGYGGTANCFEGLGPAPAPSNTLAIHRADSGCTDSDNNASDFSSLNPVPRNSSYSYTCFPTAVRKIPGEEGILIYPNPVKNQLTINDLRFAIERAEIYDMLGNLVFSQKPKTKNQRQIPFDVSHLVSGVYFVLLKSEQNIFSQKFVIAR